MHESVRPLSMPHWGSPCVWTLWTVWGVMRYLSSLYLLVELGVAKPHQRLVQVAENGRMNLPADVRRALGLTGAGRIILTQDENGVLLTTSDHALKRVRALAAAFKPEGRSVVDELLSDRREAAARESDQGEGADRG